MATRTFVKFLSLATLLTGQVAADAFCENTKSGMCTLTLIGDFDPKESFGYDYSRYKIARVHDNNCHVIGERTKNDVVYQYLASITPFSIFSTLPWTTDVTFLIEVGDYNQIGMKYGGYEYTGHFDCAMTADVIKGNANNQNNVCRHTFPCR
ncbi:hypothetical protein SUNI508_04466 [Seiridium unicorne]|uniref:Uncharacterized protein n=1 Tax=Seiridium unicorne TaxID=138068 RepID=A0ABR2V8D1_9PEZI